MRWTNNASPEAAFPCSFFELQFKTVVLSMCLSLQLNTQANPYTKPIALLTSLALQSHWMLLLWLLLSVLVGRCGEHSSWNREYNSR
jgi:hypothetical protein